MPFRMHAFDGRIICGKQGGLAFVEAVRPSIETKACPDGFEPCSELTSIENTICFDSTLPKEDQCPITAFQFIKKDETSTLPNATELEFVGNVLLAFSKDADALPASKIKLERSACADPSYQVQLDPLETAL